MKPKINPKMQRQNIKNHLFWKRSAEVTRVFCCRATASFSTRVCSLTTFCFISEISWVCLWDASCSASCRPHLRKQVINTNVTKKYVWGNVSKYNVNEVQLFGLWIWSKFSCNLTYIFIKEPLLFPTRDNCWHFYLQGKDLDWKVYVILPVAKC